MRAAGCPACRAWKPAHSANPTASSSARATSCRPGRVDAMSWSVMALGGLHLDGDGDAVGDHVVDRRSRLRARDDFAQLLVGRVALDGEAHADVGEAVAVVVVDAETAADVHLALESRFDLGQAHAAGGRDVDQ